MASSARPEPVAATGADDLVAVVSHELRTPLTSVIGYLEVLMDGEAGALEPGQEALLGGVRRGAERMLRLVNDLLYVSEARAGVGRLEVTEVDLVQVAADAVEGHRRDAAARGVGLALGGDVSVTLRGDGGRLAQLVDNLVSNALKYTLAGGRVTVSATVRGGAAVLTVADTGVGMAASERERAFDRFERGTGKAPALSPGTGLGLAICRSIVAAHGGTITLAARPGGGTRAVARLPLGP
jgi:signal transduction histidine kinase